MTLTQITNQELLEELNQRMEDGSIAIQTNTKLSTDPLTAKLFNFRVSNEDGTGSSTSTGLFDSKTLLFGLTLGVIIFLVCYRKNFTVDSNVEFLINKDN